MHALTRTLCQTLRMAGTDAELSEFGVNACPRLASAVRCPWHMVD